MKKIIVTLLSLVMVLTLSVCAFADNDSFDPTLKIETSDDGKTITVTMNELPDGVSAELTIPCDGWEWATVKDSSGKTVEATFGEVDTNPDPEVKQIVDAVTFDAVGGTYTITKSSAPSGGYYPIVTPETTPVEKPTETKPTTPAQTTTPPAEVTVPVSGDENTINVEVSVSGTTATIDKVDMTKLEGVIGDDVAVGTVTIDFSVLDKAIDTVEIPANVVKEIAAAVNDPNNDAKSLEVVLNEGMSIEFDAKALANKAAQADGLDITISMKHVSDSAINDHQKSAIGDRVAFDINVTSGGEHITDMGGEVIVHAPYVLRDGEEAAGIVVCYVDDAGNKEKCETNYDSVKQRVNWKTTHFSVYMIDYDATLVDDAPAVDAPPVVDDAPQSEATNDIGLWIGVALVVLVIAIVIVAVAIKRKK